MNQHPKAKAAGLYPEQLFRRKGTNSIGGREPILVGAYCAGRPETITQMDAALKIAADAHNTMNAYGHTPSEMVAINRELRSTLKEVADCSYTRHIAKAVLAKTEDFA